MHISLYILFLSFRELPFILSYFFKNVLALIHLPNICLSFKVIVDS